MRARVGRAVGVVSTCALLAGLTVGLAAQASAATAVTLYVDPAGTSSTCAGPGAAACPTVQQAVTVAETYSASDVTVSIAAGTYTEHVAVGVVPSGDTLTLRGASSATTVLDGSGTGPVITHDGGTLTVRSLGVTGGQASGGLAYRGGGINSAAGALTLIGDRFFSNAASQTGGGVYSHGTSLRIDSSTFDHNVASGYSPFSDGGGGGVASAALTTTVVNSTFDQNRETGGPGADLIILSAGYYNPGPYPIQTATATITGSTFADAQGFPPNYVPSGLALVVPFAGYPVRATVTGSVLSGSSCYVTPGDNSAGGDAVLTDGGGNVESTDTCGFGSSSTVNSSTIDLSGTLAANGHPDAPLTLSIDATSSARNVVPAASCPATDERGVSRAGATCDAGAYEYDAANPPPPPPPVAGDVQLESDNGASVSTDLAAVTNTYGRAAKYTIGTPPAHGRATIKGSVATYTPTRGYYGSDSFTYVVTTSGGSATGTVNISVLLPPVAHPDKSTTYGSKSGPGTTVAIEVLGNDEARSSNLYITAVGTAAHGTVTTDGAVVRYTPAKKFFGKDIFTYTEDNNYGTASTTVTVVVKK